MKTILVIVHSTRNGCIDRLRGIYDYAHSQNWNVQVVEHLRGGGELCNAVAFFHPIGAIVDCAGCEPVNLPEEFATIPIVFNDVAPQTRCSNFCISTDSAGVGEMAARHLLNLRLPNYAFVSFGEPCFWSKERGRAFTDAVAAANRTCRSFLSPPRQSVAVRHRKLTAWLRALPRPCGLFAANDIVAEEVETIVRDLGISIPNELAILGVDNNTMLCENQSPTLSSVALDFTRGAYLAAELLGRRLSQPTLKPQTVVLRAERVVVRQSTRRTPCDPSCVAEALEFIRTKAADGITVKDVVDFMRTPRRTAEMHFRETTGRSIHDEIEAVRMDMVETLLRRPNQTLGAIASLCGYATEGALRKAFRLRNGMSMREWRECSCKELELLTNEHPKTKNTKKGKTV